MGRVNIFHPDVEAAPNNLTSLESLAADVLAAAREAAGTTEEVDERGKSYLEGWTEVFERIAATLLGACGKGCEAGPGLLRAARFRATNSGTWQAPRAAPASFFSYFVTTAPQKSNNRQHCIEATVIAVSVINANLKRAKRFQQVIDATGRYKCVSLYEDLAIAQPSLLAVHPRIVLFDSQLSKNIECLKPIKSKMTDTEFLAIMENIEAETVVRAIEGGASGFLDHRAKPSSIIEALDVVSSGGSPLSPQIARIVLLAFTAAPVATLLPRTLTRRESEVLAEIVKGRMLKEITGALHISQGTLNTHLRNLYRKLRVNSRSEIMSSYFSGKWSPQQAKLPVPSQPAGER